MAEQQRVRRQCPVIQRYVQPSSIGSAARGLQHSDPSNSHPHPSTPLFSSLPCPDNDITGDILLDLTHDTLKDMGMHSTGRRIRLLKMIAELRLHVADLALQDVEGGPDTPESLVDEPAFDRLAIN